MKNISTSPAVAVLAALGVFSFACTAPETAADLDSGQLEFTTASMESRQALQDAMTDWQNVYPTAGLSHAEQAVAMDSTFALARAVKATLATDLTPEQREEELNRAVADAANASQGEMVFAAAMRARALGNVVEARGLAKVGMNLMPRDPAVAYFHATSYPALERIEMIRGLTEEFPTFAPAFNELAYRQWNEGDTANALLNVEHYVQLLPSHPNSHDSFAEMLQFVGRHDEAVEHYEEAFALDADYLAALQGIGEAHLLAGRGEEARAAYGQFAELVPAPAAKLNNRALSAATYLVDGAAADAVRELMTVARDAEQQGLLAQAAGLHRNVAMIEAAFGNAASLAGHFAKAAELAPGLPAQEMQSGLAYALSAQPDLAEAAAARFDAAVPSPNAAQQANRAELGALIAIARGDLPKARQELEQAGAGMLGKAALGTALKAGGNTAEAEALKAEVLRSTGLGMSDFIARAMAQRI